MKKPVIRKSIVWKVVLALLVVFMLMQFYRIDKTNPPMEISQDFMTNVEVPTAMANMIKGACYDCHSHETKYPWYTDVMPFSKWIQGHIITGRKHLNFSTWSSYPVGEQKHLLEECSEVLVETRMPMTSYLIAHSAARISKEERKALADWFASLSNQLPGQ